MLSQLPFSGCKLRFRSPMLGTEVPLLGTQTRRSLKCSDHKGNVPSSPCPQNSHLQLSAASFCLPRGDGNNISFFIFSQDVLCSCTVALNTQTFQLVWSLKTLDRAINFAKHFPTELILTTEKCFVHKTFSSWYF